MTKWYLLMLYTSKLLFYFFNLNAPFSLVDTLREGIQEAFLWDHVSQPVEIKFDIFPIDVSDFPITITCRKKEKSSNNVRQATLCLRVML